MVIMLSHERFSAEYGYQPHFLREARVTGERGDAHGA